MDKFAMSSSPHVRAKESTRRIMIDVIIALLPATACGVYFFGIDALWIILVCVASAVGTEAVLQKLMRRKVTAFDGSAALTGLLLALNLPVMAPGMLWLPFVGAAFAIAIVKQAFGGIGSNGKWWSSTEESSSNAWFRFMHYFSSEVIVYHGSKYDFISVRCLRD